MKIYINEIEWYRLFIFSTSGLRGIEISQEDFEYFKKADEIFDESQEKLKKLSEESYKSYKKKGSET